MLTTGASPANPGGLVKKYIVVRREKRLMAADVCRPGSAGPAAGLHCLGGRLTRNIKEKTDTVADTLKTEASLTRELGRGLQCW